MEEIRTVVLERAAAVAAKDPRAMLAHNAPGIVEFTLAPPLRQPESTVESVSAWLATFEESMSLEVTDLEVTAGDDVAFCTSLNCLTATPKGMPESFTLWFRSTLGLRKVAGRWVVTHEHESVPFDMDGSFKASIDLKP
ncbi:YybH family protein [Nucisporomicrobium flavum]|uniref:YybH family protein n=1 Tax=Nucisporomicrobium flavum TaxID=2785915 RepID=UPI0018F41ECE|nr:nuclear transport factor 2 family protein [Nucisporomicrobium flavum]